jgi:hypothetical protein
MNRYLDDNDIEMPWSMASTENGTSLFLLDSNQSVVQVMMAPFKTGWTLITKRLRPTGPFERDVVAALDDDPLQVLESLITRLTDVGSQLIHTSNRQADVDERDVGFELCRFAERLASAVSHDGLAKAARSAMA